MSLTGHKDSQFVVCRACKKYFYQHDLSHHQANDHADYQWDLEKEPSKFYYLTNDEVTWTLNRLREIQTTINALRLLVL